VLIPTCWSSAAAARLLDTRSARRSVYSERSFWPDGSQGPPTAAIGRSRCWRSVPGPNPRSRAAAKMIGLNAEPACRRAWVARLKLLARKSRPPTRASTSPRTGSMATKLPCRSFAAGRVLTICAMRVVTASSASRWSAGS
jgi:hypothetical protein